MKKEKYIKAIRSNPHADELIRMGFNTAVRLLATEDDEISIDDMFDILEVITEVENDYNTL